MVNGKPEIFGAVGDNKGAPVYVFETQEAFDAAIEAHLIPVGALIVKTYDAIEMAGGPFDAELSEESENAPQNKAVASEVFKKATLEDFGRSKIVAAGVTDVTEVDGLVCGAFEKNPNIEGTLRNEIEKLKQLLEWKHIPLPAVISSMEGAEVEKTYNVDLIGYREVCATIFVDGFSQVFNQYFPISGGNSNYLYVSGYGFKFEGYIRVGTNKVILRTFSSSHNASLTGNVFLLNALYAR